jgi:hypothetical protein
LDPEGWRQPSQRKRLKLLDYQIIQSPKLRMPSCELASRFQLSGGAVGERSGFKVHLDIAAMQMPADQLLGQRILDMALDGAAKRTGPV